MPDQSTEASSKDQRPDTDENNNKKELTHQRLKGIECPEGKDLIRLWDQVVSNLQVRVYQSGTKSFFVRYRLDGTYKCPKIGEFPEMSLREARGKAMEVKTEVSKGNDPFAEDQPEQDISFEDLADRYKRDYLPTLAESTQKESRRIIDKHIIPAIGGKSADDINPNDIRKIMNQVVEEAREGNRVSEGPKAGHRMANRVKDTISSIFSNTKTNFRNPCTEVSKLPERDSDPEKDCLSEKQIQTLWEVLETEPLITSSLIKMILITGQRIIEVKQMRWNDIDEDSRIWTLPASITKSSRTHKLPLTDLAMEVLEQVREETGDDEWVFQSPSPLNDGHVSSLSSPRQRIKDKGDFEKGEFKFKSLRTTVRTNLADLKVPPNIADRILNHAPKTVSDRHYDAHYYLDEKRDALQKWTDKLKQIIGKE